MPSEARALRRWLTDIQYNIAKAEDFVGGVTEAAFLGDSLRVYAVTRCLEIISEASRRLPDELKARHPSISWAKMASAGNIYRHDYDNVAADFLWQTVTRSLPPLRDIVDAELAALEKAR